MPQLSIIIAVYNDWVTLDACLHSVAQQAYGPELEVIVVDDGSAECAPPSILRWTESLALTVVRQFHSGISAARNHGINVSRGAILLFIDADSRLRSGCLTALEKALTKLPKQDCFQLRLIGNCPLLAGRTEHLRLVTLQNQMVYADGRIRYLNTAGFAIRRSSPLIMRGGELFDQTALRAEDTLLLATLIQRGELPFFVSEAIIQHDVSMSVFECFRKDIKSAILEGSTFSLIASRGVRIRMSHRERVATLWSAWKVSRQPSIGFVAWLMLAMRQSVQRIVSWSYRCLHRPSSTAIADSTLHSRL